MINYSGTGLTSRLGSARGGYFYNDPAFVEAEQRLREQAGQMMSRRRMAAARRGFTGEDLERAMTPMQMGLARAFQDLYTRQTGIEAARREALAERRRRRRGAVLGFLTTAPFSIAGLAMQRRGLGQQEQFGQRYLDILGGGLQRGMAAPAQAPAQAPALQGFATPPPGYSPYPGFERDWTRVYGGGY